MLREKTGELPAVRPRLRENPPCSAARLALVAADVAVRDAIEANIQALIADEDDLKAQQFQISSGIKTFTETQAQAASHLAKIQEENNQSSNELAQLNARALAILRSNLAPVEKAAQVDALGGEIRLRQSLLESQQALAQSVRRGLAMADPQRATLENYLRDLQSQTSRTQQARRNLEAVSTLYEMFFTGKRLEIVLLRQTETRKGSLPSSIGTLLDPFAPSNNETDERANAAARVQMEQREAERMKKIAACIEKGGFFVACHAQFPAGGR